MVITLKIMLVAWIMLGAIAALPKKDTTSEEEETYGGGWGWFIVSPLQKLVAKFQDVLYLSQPRIETQERVNERRAMIQAAFINNLTLNITLNQASCPYFRKTTLELIRISINAEAIKLLELMERMRTRRIHDFFN